jgi:cytochrome b subunit of formate dehydrogenase
MAWKNKKSTRKTKVGICMPAENVFDNVINSEQEKELETDYFTYVEGVGSVPRDIYRHVTSDPLGDLPRYSVHIVIQHFLVFTTFIFLAATGLPIYFSDVFWAPYVVSLFGGIETARSIHRIGAMIMMFASAYHIVTIIAGTIRKIIKNEFDIRRTQIPMPKDLFDMIHDIKYFLGLEAYRPKMGKFMYKQKLHYLAIIWGTLVLMIAGSALLFPDLMAKFFPSTIAKMLPLEMTDNGSFSAFFQDLARLMHADEAMMALIVVAFWHLTNVHLVPGRFPAQWTFLTGRITREHQIEEHFLEYLNNLREIPEEREYMRSLLIELGIVTPRDEPAAFQEDSVPEKGGPEPEKENKPDSTASLEKPSEHIPLPLKARLRD